jgi:hypothetical protein
MELTREVINELAEGAIILEGFDDCIVGISEEFGKGPRLIYSKNKIIHSLMVGIDYEEALDYYYYNILGGYFGEQNPIFLLDDIL